MTPITRMLAHYAASSRYEALPPAVQHEGVRAFVNWVGCAAGGAREDMVERMAAGLGKSADPRDHPRHRAAMPRRQHPLHAARGSVGRTLDAGTRHYI